MIRDGLKCAEIASKRIASAANSEDSSESGHRPMCRESLEENGRGTIAGPDGNAIRAFGGDQAKGPARAKDWNV